VVLQRGDQHDRDERGGGIAFQPPADLEAAGIRKQHIQQHQVRRRMPDGVGGAPAVGHAIHRHAFVLEKQGEIRGHVGIVIHHQHAEARPGTRILPRRRQVSHGAHS
jgi:hypothetical protein